MSIQVKTRNADKYFFHIKKLTQDYFTFIQGADIQDMLDCTELDIKEFSDQWNSLELDQYMGHGGRYRYRRYGQFNKMAMDPDLTLLPHAPYVQSKEVNYLNGGVKRKFEPLTTEFSQSPVLIQVLSLMSELYDKADGKANDWNIHLHPYRIVATAEQMGKPSPEGLHRDGVTFIASMMINRHNISGGVTTLTDSYRQPKATVELTNPFDIIIADDARTLHDVSPIEASGNDAPGTRDVLVIAFTKLEQVD
ncbi:hypothetical protein VHA01S_030_00490 [Vibrio halioticoli NBRC 102217]|uniref:2OG-Fe dioxygenase family protein n=1 Tax=Vibrio halioticoli NBRC 102217 TaxID=1219072 RepID=V5F436_9VIBR|nr:2OG-Fe dioxygenase family protein [Vibrio halioticoli]GAD89974.1 hypothetical protein VHA01S_030_00490 [Vibrio halioticoli NBRC 102217]